MKTLIVSGMVLALLTGSALAQTPPSTPPVAPEGSARAAAPAPLPPPGPDPMADTGAAPPPPPAGPEGRRPPPPPSRAAHFRLERGDAALDVKCGEDETMKACADIALQMLDKMQAMTPAKP